MKKIYLLCFVLIMATMMPLFGKQKNPVDTTKSKTAIYDYTVSFTVKNRNIWRGTLVCNQSTPVIQPIMAFSVKGFQIMAFGSFSMSSLPLQEADLYLSYTFWKQRFTVYFSDYCFPNEFNESFNYFDYHNATTAHAFEAGLSYNGEENVPVSAGIYCIVHGADAKDAHDKNLFSSYAEIAYKPYLKKVGVGLEVFLGCGLNGQDRWADNDGDGKPEVNLRGFYGNKGFAVVNVGLAATKRFVIKDRLQIPISASFIVNPATKKAFIMGGVGIVL